LKIDQAGKGFCTVAGTMGNSTRNVDPSCGWLSTVREP